MAIELQENKKVGVRDFRENLAKYIDNEEPLAVTKHGETVGYYIPTKAPPKKSELDSLITASKKMQQLLKKAELDEDALVNKFKALRRKSK